MASNRESRNERQGHSDRPAPKAGAGERAASASHGILMAQAVSAPHTLGSDSIMQLQRGAGNRALGQLINGPAERQPIQKKNETGMPDRLKSGIESLSGLSLDDVKVHYGSDKPAKVQASAYAQGTDIYVGSGQEKHLPHEAWHVVQQKQGRVQPTGQLNSLPVNDDPGLESEADRMGSRALQTPASDGGQTGGSGTAAGSVQRSAAPIQAMLVNRGGTIEWEDDPYELKDGETEYIPSAFQLAPAVVFDSGSQVASFDGSGTQQINKRKADPPTHKELQETRREQGREQRRRIKKDLSKLGSYTTELESTAEELEELAGDALPKDHKKKVRKAYKKGTVKGADFRGFSKKQDEFTQSQGSTAFIGGYREPGGDTPPHYSQQLNDYGEQMLRTMSAYRGPTSAIVAPIDDNGSTTGQQHPTSKDQPKLPGGGSGHSYADRGRLDSQNEAYEELSQVQGLPPNFLFYGSMLASGVSTLSTMSAPLAASNVPDFNSGGHEQQRQDREAIKEQTNVLATRLGLETASGEQDYDAPWTARDTPTSPRRMDEEETAAAKKKKTKKKKNQTSS
ncbi:eCIS core domain-containing protein [Paenibacillus arenilitoris]|uniref:eCIS core domain-containing protein n=1 Tax=Paenibacillus arenilitoris TaxID=2772299 RepID=UPI001CC256DC|nr:DUF4157 domain-containing protein [Paenibacillus arenilitoris]